MLRHRAGGSYADCALSLRHCTELCILCIDFYLSAQGPAESYISRRAGPARRRLGIDPLFPLQNMVLRICRRDVTR